MKILVTGAGGFLGGSVTRHASRRGHQVARVDRALLGSADALAHLIEAEAPDVVLHAAGTASVAASIASPGDDFAGSVVTWEALLEAVRRSGRRPVVVLPSSAAVYGDPASLPVREDAPARPISPYGFHKLCCETLADAYAACFGLDVIVARLFSVFGPAQRRLLVWEIYAQLAGPGEAVALAGTGRETRDFLHVDDVAEALIRLAASPLRGLGRAEVVNVASGEEIAVLDLAARLRDLVAPGKEIACRGAHRPGDPQRWQADVTRLASRVAPYRPRPLADALAACVEAWRRESA
jgi:nucleoside-diphosphate-sugar epimerase